MIGVDRPLPETVPRGRLFGLARMAAVVLDGTGRVRHWSAAAEELFGVAAAYATGLELGLLLEFSPDGDDPFALALRHAAPGDGTAMAHCSAGAVRARGGRRPVRDVAWWIYPLGAEAGGGVLAFATDAERLRASGPGLALSGETLLAPPDQPITEHLGVQCFHVEPVVVPAPPEAGKSLGDQILDMLRAMGAETGERLMEHVRRAGYPAMSLTLTAELPFVPYGETTARQRPLVPLARPQPVEHVPALVREDELIEARATRERLAFLNETGARVGTSLDLEQTARDLAEALVPRFADFACVQLLDEYSSGEDMPRRSSDGYVVRRLAVVHDDPPGRWEDVVPEGEVFRLPEGSPWETALVSGRAVHMPRVTAAMAEALDLGWPDRDLRPLLTGRSLLIVPLVARGVALGSLVLQRKPDRLSFDGIDVDAVEALAQRVGLSVDNARLFRQESRAAETLQRGMLPSSPPDLPGLEVRYRYLPASRAVKVGGDWFDTIPLPGGRVALVVGDVMGHGLQSASVMGQLRTALRTLAPLDLPPDEVLRQLDELAQRLGDDRIATCVYCVYDPVTHVCEIGNAGHVPPVFIHPGGRSELLEIPAGAPIGVGGVPFGTLRLPVPPGSRIVLCTDGLVELRGRDIDVGLNALRAEVSGTERPLDEVTDAVIDTLCGGGDRLDDVAVLLASFSGLSGEDVVSWRLPAEPSEVRRARALTRAALREWGIEDLADTVELLVSELFTNAIRYAAGPVGLRMIRTDVLLCEVDDTGHHLPNLCRPRDDEESGRGVFLVSHLARRWGTHRTSTGKVVWFDLALENAG